MVMHGIFHGRDGIATLSDKLGDFGPPSKKVKRGPRTIGDNFLEGNRDAWVQLLEEAWLQGGWPLLRIRDMRTSTIEDVRKALEPVKGMPHNPGLAESFYRQTVEPALVVERFPLGALCSR